MPIPYTQHLRSDGAKMAATAARDLDAHVPTCPDWNVAKLVIHTGQHHRWVADAVGGGGRAPEAPSKPGLRGEALIEWFERGWGDLADLLDVSDDETPAWSWSGDNRVGFWRRRTALETAVHRWDAENATGEGSPIDPELARDGVDEIFFVTLPREVSPQEGGAEGSVLFETTDHPGAWSLKLKDGDSPRIERAAGEAPAGDATVRAPAHEMLLYLWGRLGTDSIEVSGDDSLFEAVHALVR